MLRRQWATGSILLNVAKSLTYTLPRTPAIVVFLQLARIQIRTFTSDALMVSPALLSRAQSVAREHDVLSKQLSSHFDSDVARKLGELAATAKALKDWAAVENVHYPTEFQLQ